MGWNTSQWNLFNDLQAQVMGGKWYPPREDILESLQDRKSEPPRIPPVTVQVDGEKETKVGKTFSQASTIPASSIKSGPASTVSVQQNFRTQLTEFQRKLASTPVEPPRKSLGKLPPAMVQPQPTLSKAQIAENQMNTDLKAVGKIELSDESPRSQAPREVLSRRVAEMVGDPVVRAKEGQHEPIARLMTPVSSLAGAKLLRPQPQKAILRTSGRKGPLRPVTPTASQNAEDALRQTRLDVGFTAADFEFLADLKGEVQNPLPGTRAIQPDGPAVERAPEDKVKAQTDGDAMKMV